MSMMNLDSPDVLVIGAGACDCLVGDLAVWQRLAFQALPLPAAGISILTNHKQRKLFI